LEARRDSRELPRHVECVPQALLPRALHHAVERRQDAHKASKAKLWQISSLLPLLQLLDLLSAPPPTLQGRKAGQRPLVAPASANAAALCIHLQSAVHEISQPPALKILAAFRHSPAGFSPHPRPHPRGFAQRDEGGDQAMMGVKASVQPRIRSTRSVVAVRRQPRLQRSLEPQSTPRPALERRQSAHVLVPHCQGQNKFCHCPQTKQAASMRVGAAFLRNVGGHKVARIEQPSSRVCSE
jgi:hypothetical protein